MSKLKIYTANEADVLHRDAVRSAGRWWYRVEVPGGDSIDGPDGSTEPTCNVDCEGHEVARCESPEVAALVAAAPDLAASVVHYAHQVQAANADIERLRAIINAERGIAAYEGWERQDRGWWNSQGKDWLYVYPLAPCHLDSPPPAFTLWGWRVDKYVDDKRAHGTGGSGVAGTALEAMEAAEFAANFYATGTAPIGHVAGTP